MIEDDDFDDDYVGESYAYRGNENLKKPGTPINFTPDMTAEFIKCKLDPVYFVETYVRFITLDDGFVNIKLHDFQKEVIDSYLHNRRTAVLTSRQVGKTTIATGIILHYILFNRSVKVGILANKQDSAIEVMERIQLAYEALPLWLQQGVVTYNKKKLALENKSQVIAAATSASSIRGKAVNFLYIDEAAHVENWDEFYASTYPVITSGKDTKIMLTTTPLGMNHFYKIWEDATKDRADPYWNGFNPIQVMWNDIPGRGEEWRLENLAALGHDQEKFNQEFCCEFYGSSGTLISGATLKSLTFKEPIHTDDIGIKQYEKVIADHIYVLMADVSRGKGLDYSTFHVLDVTEMPYKQVCTFRSNIIMTGDFADVINYVAHTYNDAFVMVENNDIGAEVPNILHNTHEYSNILYSDTNGRSGKTLSFGGKTAERGIRVSASVKGLGCSLIKALIEEKRLLIQDFETISEFSTFSKKGTSYAAEEGKHDDLVMPLVIFGWMSTQPYFKELTNSDILRQLKAQTIDQIQEKMVPFGFIVNGLDDPQDTYFDALEDAFFRF
jgi:hypothetical protein